MPYFVAVDIGCIECGEGSDVLGIFTSESKAEEIAESARKKQKEDWHGQHSFEVFEVPEITGEKNG